MKHKKRKPSCPDLYQHKASVIKVMVAILRDVMGCRLEDIVLEVAICWRMLERYESELDAAAVRYKEQEK